MSVALSDPNSGFPPDSESTSTSSSPSRPPRFKILFLWALCALLLFVGLSRWHLGGMGLPLEQDELVTLKKYTSTPYDFNSAAHQGAGHWNLPLLVRGWVKCFLNPWDPNNHIGNSLLASFSAFGFGLHEWSLRLPALLAFVAMLGLFLWQASRRAGIAAGLLLALLLSVHPHFIQYSMACRGYAMNSFLVLVAIALAGRFLKNPTLQTGGCLAACHLLLFLNLGSMLITWVGPMTLVLLWNTLAREPQSLPMVARLRKAGLTLWISAATFVAAGLYILGCLHYFIEAQARYGISFKGTASLLARLKDLATYLSPTPGWAVLLLAGVVGFALMLRTERRWLAQFFFLSIAVFAGYSLLTHKFIYPRTLGYYTVLCSLGYVELWAWTRRNVWLQRAMGAVVVWSLATSTLNALQPGESKERTFSELAVAIRNECKARSAALIELPWIYGEEMPAYLPEGDAWYTLKPQQVGSNLSLLYPCVVINGQPYFRAQTRVRSAREHELWPIPAYAHQIIDLGNLGVWEAKMKVHRGFEEMPVDANQAVIVWNQKDRFFNLARYVAEGLASKETPWPMQATTMVAQSLHLFVSSPKEMAAARMVIGDLQKRTEGEVYVLVPE